MQKSNLPEFFCSAFYFLVLTSVAIAPGSAYAKLRVLESNTPDYPVGKVLQNDTHFKLGKGCFVRAMKTESNETVLFQGPAMSNPPMGGTRSLAKDAPPCR